MNKTAIIDGVEDEYQAQLQEDLNEFYKERGLTQLKEMSS